MSKSEFVIKKGAFITCFTPFIFNTTECKDVKDIIAYSALLKKDLTVNYDQFKRLLPRIGIEKLTIIYISREDFDLEFYKGIVDFEQKNFNDNSNFHFQSADIRIFMELALKGRINLFKGRFDTKHCLFIFHGFDWKSIVFQFKKNFNVNISGGNSNKRHLLSHLVLKLNTCLLGLSNFNYKLLADSIVFDGVDNEKILPRFNFNKKNIQYQTSDTIFIDKYEDIFADSNPTIKNIRLGLKDNENK